jgi:hypothetical protein
LSPNANREAGQLNTYHVTKFIHILILFEAITAIAMAQGPGGLYPHCELSVNISAESMNPANDEYIKYFDKGETVTLRFELMNKLKKDDYNKIQVKYNISNLYIFPLKSVKATYENKSKSDGLFSISFDRSNMNKGDYFEIDKNGFLDLYCKDFLPLEKIYFNFSTQISNRPNMSGGYEIAGLREDNIVFDSNRIRRDNGDGNFDIRNLNEINIKEDKTRRESQTPTSEDEKDKNIAILIKTTFLLILLFFIFLCTFFIPNLNNRSCLKNVFSWDEIPGKDSGKLIEFLIRILALTG